MNRICNVCHKSKEANYEGKKSIGTYFADIYRDDKGRQWYYGQCPDCRKIKGASKKLLIKGCRKCKGKLKGNYFYCFSCSNNMQYDFNEDFLYAAF